MSLLLLFSPGNKLSNLTDNFTSATRDAAKWTQFGSATAPSQASGTLDFTTSTTAGYGGYSSLTTTYDITSSAASVQLVATGNQSLASLEVYPVQVIKSLDTTNLVWWFFAGGLIRPYKKVAGVQTALSINRTLSLATYKYLRIREASGTTYWEYSADGTTWTIEHSEANPFSMSSVSVELTTGTYAAEASGTVVSLDNFNILVTSIAYTQTPADNITTSDSVTFTKVIVRTATDSVTTADSVTNLRTVSRSVSDSITTTDNATTIRATKRSATDSVTASDSTSYSRGIKPTIADSVTVTDATSKVSAQKRTLTDSVSATDNVSKASGNSRTVADSVTTNDSTSAIKAISPTISDSVTATDSTSKVSANVRSLADTVNVNDSTSSSSSIGGVAKTGSGADNVTVTDNVTFSKAAKQTINDSVTTSDNVTKTSGLFRSHTSDVVSITESVNRVLAIRRTQTDTTTITDSASTVRGLLLNLADSVTVTDNATSVKGLTSTSRLGFDSQRQQLFYKVNNNVRIYL